MYLVRIRDSIFFSNTNSKVKLPACGLDELALIVEDAALADLVYDLQFIILGLSLQLGRAVDVGLALHMCGITCNM